MTIPFRHLLLFVLAFGAALLPAGHWRCEMVHGSVTAPGESGNEATEAEAEGHAAETAELQAGRGSAVGRVRAPRASMQLAAVARAADMSAWGALALTRWDRDLVSSRLRLTFGHLRRDNGIGRSLLI